MTVVTLPQIGIAKAATIFGVSNATVRRWIKTGRLKAVLIGSRYRTSEAWMEESSHPACAVASDAERSKKDGEDFDETLSDLARTFGIGPKVPVPKMLGRVRTGR